MSKYGLTTEHGDLVAADREWTTDQAEALVFDTEKEASEYRRSLPGTDLWVIEIQ